MRKFFITMAQLPHKSVIHELVPITLDEFAKLDLHDDNYYIDLEGCYRLFMQIYKFVCLADFDNAKRRAGIVVFQPGEPGGISDLLAAIKNIDWQNRCIRPAVKGDNWLRDQMKDLEVKMREWPEWKRQEFVKKTKERASIVQDFVIHIPEPSATSSSETASSGASPVTIAPSTPSSVVDLMVKFEEEPNWVLDTLKKWADFIAEKSIVLDDKWTYCIELVKWAAEEGFPMPRNYMPVDGNVRIEWEKDAWTFELTVYAPMQLEFRLNTDYGRGDDFKHTLVSYDSRVWFSHKEEDIRFRIKAQLDYMFNRS